MKIIFYIVIFLFLSINAFAEPQVECKGNPDLCGECKTIRGRLSVYNGTPSLRIWIVGTNRLLGIVPSESEIMPDKLLDIFKQNPAARVFADFDVCPLSVQREGYMQSVCIESFSNIRIE